MSRSKGKKEERPAKGPSAGSTPRPAASRRRVWLVVGLVVLAAGAVGLVLRTGRIGPGSRQVAPGSGKAVIVDQLELTAPNPAFVRQATELLEGAGYSVDYIPGKDVTVDFYRTLPQRGYDFVLLRVHSARREEAGVRTDDVALFTGELVDPIKYSMTGIPEPVATAVAQAQAQGGISSASVGRSGQGLGADELRYLSPVFYSPREAKLPFFGVMPAFIEQELDGQFKPATTVVLMGCDGLRSDALAKAFTARGAQAFVSWDRPVTVTRTDNATERLLSYLFKEGFDTAEAVTMTMYDIGQDPDYGGSMVYFTRPEAPPVPQ